MELPPFPARLSTLLTDNVLPICFFFCDIARDSPQSFHLAFTQITFHTTDKYENKVEKMCYMFHRRTNQSSM